MRRVPSELVLQLARHASKGVPYHDGEELVLAVRRLTTGHDGATRRGELDVHRERAPPAAVPVWLIDRDVAAQDVMVIPLEPSRPPPDESLDCVRLRNTTKRDLQGLHAP